MKTLILCLGLLLGTVLTTYAQTRGAIKVTFEDIASDEGTLKTGLYNSAGSWLDEAFKAKSSVIKNGKCEVVFEDIPYGEYGVSAYHDENNNGKMDKYLGFYPKENYACSNQAPAKYGPPQWKDAKFQINQKTNQQHIKF